MQDITDRYIHLLTTSSTTDQSCISTDAASDSFKQAIADNNSMQDAKDVYMCLLTTSSATDQS